MFKRSNHFSTVRIKHSTLNSNNIAILKKTQFEIVQSTQTLGTKHQNACKATKNKMVEYLFPHSGADAPFWKVLSLSHTLQSAELKIAK